MRSKLLKFTFLWVIPRHDEVQLLSFQQSIREVNDVEEGALCELVDRDGGAEPHEEPGVEGVIEARKDPVVLAAMQAYPRLKFVVLKRQITLLQGVLKSNFK